jgi:hypothetical protein
MLPAMTLVSQWRQIEASLPEDWEQAHLSLAVADVTRVDRAAALLGPLAPGRSQAELHFSAARAGWPGPEAVRRLLARLDAERIGGALVLTGAARGTAPESAATTVAASLAAGWDELVATLPDDWSDLLCQLELNSSDDLPRAALLMAPLNPAREHGDPPGFRFRVARRFGYGTSPEMTRRCLARLDEETIRGRVRLLRALSDTKPVETQGPVWYIAGKAV